MDMKIQKKNCGGYRFFTPEDLEEDLNIEGIESSVFINLEKKKVISLKGVKYDSEKIYVLEDESNNEDKSSLCEQIVTLPISRMKPNTFMLNEIIKDYAILKADIYVVGDSKNKDIRTARLAGVNGIWAQYGMNYSQKSRRLLSAITPWTRSQKVGGHRIIPQYSIMEFAEIKNIIKL